MNTLDRMRETQPAPPGPGQVIVIVARHDAQTWPSKEVAELALQRAELLHQTADDLGITVISWGDTDAVGEKAHEVVQVVLQLAGIIVPSLATVLATWIAGRPRESTPKAPPKPSVPGMTFVRSDGSRLEITGRSGLVKEQMTRLMQEFLRGAQTEP